MRNSKTLVVIAAVIIMVAVFAAVIIMVAVFAVIQAAPKSQPAASSTGNTTLTVDTTPTLELESYQDTVDAYDLQPATTVR